MAEPVQKFTITVPRNFNVTQRRQIGDLAIETIQARTAKGNKLGGGKFKAYTQSYKDSKDFKTAGKTNTVNLELSSEMMNSIEILGQGVGFVTIGYEADTFSNDKASWLINSTAHTIRRPFLGLSEIETKAIIAQVQSSAQETNIRQVLETAQTEDGETARTGLADFLRSIRVDDSEI